MSPVQSPEFEGVSYVQWPVNFFGRKDLKGLFKKWGAEASHWLMAIMTAVRESKSRDRLEISGQPITREDLDLIHCWPPINPDWIPDAIQYGLFAEAEDGCLVILCRKQFVLYKNETAAAVAKQAQRAAKDTSATTAGQPQDNGATFEGQSGDKKHNTIQDNTIQSNSTQVNPPLRGGGVEEEAQEVRAVVAIAPPGGETSGGEPPGPPPPRTPKPNGKKKPDLPAYIKPFLQFRPGTQTLDQREQYAITQKVAPVAVSGGGSDEAIQQAVEAAVEQTLWQQRNGPKAIDDPVGYATSLLTLHLEGAVMKERLNRARANTGLPWENYRWTPPDD